MSRWFVFLVHFVEVLGIWWGRWWEVLDRLDTGYTRGDEVVQVIGGEDGGHDEGDEMR